MVPLSLHFPFYFHIVESADQFFNNPVDEVRMVKPLSEIFEPGADEEARFLVVVGNVEIVVVF